MSDIQVVFLGQKGEIRQGKIKATTPAGLMAALKKKEVPSVLGSYQWKQKTLFLFGYLEGKDTAENQHHLPAPLEGITYYGDILVVASAQANSYTTPIHLKTSDYETFYTNKLEGDDLDSDDELGDADGEVAADADADVADTADVADAADADVDVDYGDADADVEGDADVDDESEAPVIEKPVRAVRVRKVAAVHVEEPETELTDGPSTSAFRVRTMTVITDLFSSILSADECVDFERIVFKAAYDTASKQEIRKAWGTLAFRDVYMATARRIIGNLNPNSYVQNKNLWERFTQKELTLEQIANQNYYEMCPEQWNVMVDRQAKQEKIQLDGDFSRATDKWMCNGCKMRKCTYYELQTRSADEPMTIFIQCLNCGKRWTH